MRIGIDLRSLMESGGKISGVENYLLNILNNADFKKETEGLVFGFYNSRKKVTLPSLPIEVIRTNWPNRVINLITPKFEKLYGPLDKIWMPDPRPISINKKTKLAVTVHDLSPVIHPEFYSLKRKIWHRVIGYKKIYLRADRIFAVSEYTKLDLMRTFGIDKSKIEVVYPGINHKVFKPDLDLEKLKEIKNKYNLPDNFILSISTIEPRKNLENLIQAFEQSNVDEYLVIAGRLGWLYKNFLQLVENSPKKNKIKLLGYVEEEDKPFLIKLSSVVCYPSFYEGFGFVPLEAMACGVPVITSARTSMPEVCGDSALLIEPYKIAEMVYALEEILKDRALRDRMIERGLQRASLFKTEDCARKIAISLMNL